MRILVSMFFVRSLDLEGGERTLDSLAKSYVALGHDVTVLAPLKKKGTEYSIVDYHDQKVGLLQNMVRYLKVLKEHARSCDILHLFVVSPGTHFSGFSISDFREKTFITFGTPLLRFPLLRLNRQNLAHYLAKNRILARFWPANCQRAVVSTEFQKRQLESVGFPKDKIDVFSSWGISKADFRPYSKLRAKSEFDFGQGFVISYIGHFHHIKGVSYLVKAFEKAGGNNILALAWSGKGSDTKQVLRLIKHSPARDSIRLLGKVDVRRFLAASDIVVLPYNYMSLPHFPLVMIEAFAMGVPVITTDVGGLSEMVQNQKTGLIVKPGSVEDLASAIRLLAGDKVLRSRISVNSRRQFLSKYEIGVVARRYLRFFSKS
ncbi:MAG: glycosyltransferase family 4 protein [Candidatus Woesearchaeota archaeon]